MRVRSIDGSELMQISAFERRGNDLIIKGKIMGAMPMSATLSPSEARNGLKLLNLKLFFFLLTFLLRR